MKRRWLLIGLVVGVAGVIDLVVLPLCGAFRGGPNWLAILTISMALSHGSLLAVWAALGGKATPWRLVGAFVAIAMWIWILRSPDSGSDMAFWAVILLAELVAMSALLLIARLLGLELADALRDDSTRNSAADGQWVQYSLRSLLSWTTASAVLLGVLHYLPREPFSEFWQEPAILAAILLSSVVVALGALWIALGARWPAVRLIGLGLSAAAAVTTLWLAIGTGELWEFLVFCFVQATYLVGSLWLIRLAGYRLVWRRRVRL